MFNVRVYGILINERKEVLVADEYIKGMFITKFCGGGLEFGEGTKECLKREFKEEMNIEVTVGNHFYTTDFFQESAFKRGQQVISIYYRVIPLIPLQLPVSPVPLEKEITELQGGQSPTPPESFRFVSWQDFSAGSLTLPIDKYVAEMIKNKSFG